MSWSGTFQSFLERFEYLNKNYSQKYVAFETNVNLKDSKYFPTGELKKVCEFQLLVELLQKIRKEIIKIEIRNDKIIIKSERGKRYIAKGMKNDTIYMGDFFHEEKVFSFIYDFIQNFNSVIDIQFQKDYIFFEIRPFQRICKFYFKLKKIDELKEIKKIATENQIRLITSYTEENLLNKNPHLREVLIWENFITEDILYSSYFPNHRVSLFLKKRAPECGIIKEKSIDAWQGINYINEGNKLIDYLVFDNLSLWKEMVISNKNFWYLIDQKEKENARKKYSSKIYENPEKSSIDALSDGLPDDFGGSLEEAKRYLGLD